MVAAKSLRTRGKIQFVVENDFSSNSCMQPKAQERREKVTSGEKTHLLKTGLNLRALLAAFNNAHYYVIVTVTGL